MAKVYVGTYGKYNNGNLDGAWIDLAECATYDNFLKKCRETHKNEPDPEYMIQDYEELPDGLACGEWLSREEFNDIIKALSLPEIEETELTPLFEIIDYSEKAIAVVGDTKPLKNELKKLGGRYNPRLSCGAGWVFPKTKEPQLRDLLNGTTSKNSATPAKSTAAADTRFKDWFNEYKTLRPYDYYTLEHSVGAIKIGETYLLMDKPTIENRFCFADEGSPYEFYKGLCSSEDKLKQYFMHRNLRKYDWLDDKKQNIYLKQNGNRCHILVMDEFDFERYGYGKEHVLCEDPETLQLIREGYGWAKQQFEKRLNTYLKRYGTSKIQTWTYWADR